ncbi:VirK family protein [Pandoraea sputorum]|uniref:VirK family protein n=1 Tax=Pandoraea sputorum TaxID=93222 RepID=UPI0017828DBD|nr:VirK family protein [Pandoraea sputorum]
MLSLVAGGWTSAPLAKSADADALQEAVMTAQDIRAVLDLSLCTTHGTAAHGPAIRASLRPNAFLLMQDGTVAFSDTHLTVRADGKPVREFMKYRVLPDGKAEFQTIVLDAADFSVVQKSQYDCALGKGLKLRW